MNVEDALECLAKFPDRFKVLRSLSNLDSLLSFPFDGQDSVRSGAGLMVDCETTGLDPKTDEIIEIGLVPFKVSHDGKLFGLGTKQHFQWYRDPGIPIPSAITKLTGITDEMVSGKKIDPEIVRAYLKESTFVVAHHAKFDRKFFEKLMPEFEECRWACSLDQVPWKEQGMRSGRLDYIAMEHGYFYKAHGALADCHAALKCLSLPLGDRTGIEYLMEVAFKPTFRLWAIGSEFRSKDALKARGYFWNGGEDGRAKAWHRELPSEEAYREEVAWLGANGAYANVSEAERRAKLQVVTSRDRFTVRG